MAKQARKVPAKKAAPSRAKKKRPLYPWPLDGGPPDPLELEDERKQFEGPAPRIARIKVKGFRAFANEACVFDLTDQGKSLLLFGENGAGKTSLFRALVGILNDQQPKFAHEQNIFFGSHDDYVTVEWTSGTPADLNWQMDRIYPRIEIFGRIHELMRRVTLLSYKDLLRVHTSNRDKDQVDIFELLFDKLLRHVDLPSGKTVFMRYAEMKYGAEPRVLEGLRSKSAAKLAEARIHKEIATDDAFTFFAELGELLSVGPGCIVARANELLAYLVPGLQIAIRSAEPAKKKGVTSRFTVKVRDLNLHCTFYGSTVERPGFFLNEARLTAISLCLYLAGAERSLPSGVDAKTRILVLDDVLIGLDMSHRIPVLKMLHEQFADWQILLFTHDRVWYDLARSYTRDGGQWIHNELIEQDSGPGRPSRPYRREGQDHLVRARYLMDDYDLMGSAVHIRAWFEDLIKRKCEKFSRPIVYHENPKDYKADKFWEALKTDNRPVNGAATKMGAAIIAEVEMVRSNVLNKLSHAGTVNLVKAEVQQALDLMPRMKAALEKP